METTSRLGWSKSLRGRLLITATAVLFVFLGFTGFVLDRAFVASAEQGEAEKLLLQVYGLLAVAEETGGELFLPEELQEPRFNQLGSGLYGLITDENGSDLWRSPSALALSIEADEIGSIHEGMVTGESRFGRVADEGGETLFFLSYRIVWEGPNDSATSYTFSVIETMEPYLGEIISFRNNLWSWLGGVVVVLILVQWLVMKWGLSPLGQLADDLKAIEEGRTEYLEGDYPLEIQGVTRNLNFLISSERQQLEKYRTTLADLAHSLKTPLAILKGSASKIGHLQQRLLPEAAGDSESPAIDSDLEGLKVTLDEQIDRMDQIVTYQLQRAASSSSTLLRKSIEVKPVAEKLIDALQKVYMERDITFERSIQEAQFFGDERDLMELLGNLVDNACKYGKSIVRLSVGHAAGSVDLDPDSAEPRKSGDLMIVVEDDGKGIDKGMRASVLQRGARADTREPGQGIGLAVVADIVERYRGSISIDDSTLGGARVVLHLP